MFEISNHLKFYTCKSSDVMKLKHYWKIYTKSSGKDEYLKVLYSEPTKFKDSNFLEHTLFLKDVLNQSNPFEMKYNFIIEDIIEIVFNNDENSMIYYFKFNGLNWEFIDFENINLIIEEYNVLDSGKIINALKRNISEPKVKFLRDHI